jgi:hypothetical protein
LHEVTTQSNPSPVCPNNQLLQEIQQPPKLICS